MKKLVALLLVAAGLAATAALAVGAEKHAATKSEAAATKPVTLKGELVDTGCYLGHGARGEKHKACATKCISGGMPMGLLTADGALYLLTMDHGNPDPYNQAKDLAAEMVEVTGPVFARNGMKAIEVTAVKPVATAAK